MAICMRHVCFTFMARAEADSEGLLLLGEKPMLHERRREADVTRTAALGMAPHTHVNTRTKKINKQQQHLDRQSHIYVYIRIYTLISQSTNPYIYLSTNPSIYLCLCMYVLMYINIINFCSCTGSRLIPCTAQRILH